MAIYGDMLLYFPEQKTTFTVYQQTPLINGGWEKVEGSELVITGIHQNTKPTQNFTMQAIVRILLLTR